MFVETTTDICSRFSSRPSAFRKVATVEPSFAMDLRFTPAAIFNHCVQARAAKKREPVIQIPAITDGHTDASVGVLAMKGRLNEPKRTDKFTGMTEGVSKLRANLSPMLTRIENGSRNLSDANSHKPNRILAAFCFSNAIITATTAAKSVDCQR
jgi:hypothetical protein